MHGCKKGARGRPHQRFPMSPRTHFTSTSFETWLVAATGLAAWARCPRFACLFLSQLRTQPLHVWSLRSAVVLGGGMRDGPVGVGCFIAASQPLTKHQCKHVSNPRPCRLRSCCTPLPIAADASCPPLQLLQRSCCNAADAPYLNAGSCCSHYHSCCRYLTMTRFDVHVF